MKCSDVSNPIKSWPIYSEWIERITTEFLSQGDKEKELGLPISPFCNRESSNTKLSQKSFINFIVAPLFEAMNNYSPMKEAMEGLQKNKDRFCKEEGETPLMTLEKKESVTKSTLERNSRTSIGERRPSQVQKTTSPGTST